LLLFASCSDNACTKLKTENEDKMNQATVYVTQVPHKKDKETGAFVPTVNLSPAGEFGKLVVMMPPRAAFFSTGDLVNQMREHLYNYDIEKGDSIVALGDPAVIAVAFAILGKEKGKFIVLKWDKNSGRYLPSRVVV
jgi:hypothetical protein